MLIVHIGPRKTASTYLQANFYRNRRRLWRSGWLYPVLSLAVRNSHHDVRAALAEVRAGKGPMVDAIRMAGRRAAAKNASILMSSEGFPRWRPDDFLALGALFGQQDVRLVYVLRDPLSRMPSLWSEGVKAGKTRSLKAFAERQLAAPEASAALNCLVDLTPFLAEPRLNVTVLDFEEIRRTKGDIFTTFCAEILGVKGLNPVIATARNERQPPEIYDYLRILSRAGGAEIGPQEILYWRRFLRSHDEADLARIAETVSRLGADSLSRLRFERATPWMAALDDQARRALEGVIVPPTTRQPLFPGPDVEAISYDVTRFETHPEIQSLVAASKQKMTRQPFRWGRTRLASVLRALTRRFTV
jgi:hypothetical protein